MSQCVSKSQHEKDMLTGGIPFENGQKSIFQNNGQQRLHGRRSREALHRMIAFQARG
jgi:hypothetical protein